MTTPTSESGFFIINKPARVTSHDVVGTVRHLTDIQQTGHTGTLDPFATGVLLVAVGAATRFIQYTHDLQKTYTSIITLGATSDTDDSTGAHITPFSTHQPTKKEVQETLVRFVGEIQQIPPAYAAVKIDGKKLYEYAREGKAVAVKPRPITVHSLELLSYEYPNISIRATVSTGTYIRAFARDIGQELQTGGYVSKLHREAIGKFSDQYAINLETLTPENWHNYLQKPEELVSHLPNLLLENASVVKLQQGREVSGENFDSTKSKNVAIFDEQKNLIGVAECTPETKTLKARTILPYEQTW